MSIIIKKWNWGDEDMSKIEEVIRGIEFWDGRIPKKEIGFLCANREKAVLQLRGIIKKVLDNPQKYAVQKNYIGHKVAIYLLSQFRCFQAFDDILEIYSLPDPLAYELLGYNVTYDGCRILASLYNGDLDKLKDIIENKESSEVLKNTCIETMKILALQSVADRKVVLGFYEKLMKKSPEKCESQVECALSSSIELYPEEIIDTINNLYTQNIIDSGKMYYGHFKYTLEMEKDDVIDCYKNQEMNDFIGDILDETVFWDEVSGEI